MSALLLRSIEHMDKGEIVLALKQKPSRILLEATWVWMRHQGGSCSRDTRIPVDARLHRKARRARKDHFSRNPRTVFSLAWPHPRGGQDDGEQRDVARHIESGGEPSRHSRTVCVQEVTVRGTATAKILQGQDEIAAREPAAHQLNCQFEYSVRYMWK